MSLCSIYLVTKIVTRPGGEISWSRNTIRQQWERLQYLITREKERECDQRDWQYHQGKSPHWSNPQNKKILKCAQERSVSWDFFGLRFDIASDIVLVDTKIEERSEEQKEFSILDKTLIVWTRFSYHYATAGSYMLHVENHLTTSL